MREIFFDENSIDNGLRQAYKKIVTEGFDSYIVLAVGTGGEQIAKRLEKYWNYKNVVSCVLKNGDINILDESKIKGNKIFVCDDTTITGKTFTNIFKKLTELGANDIKLLSLLMRRNSSIVPNIFIDMYKKKGFEVIGSIQDPHYQTLHKIVIVNGTKELKDNVISTIRTHI